MKALRWILIALGVFAAIVIAIIAILWGVIRSSSSDEREAAKAFFAAFAAGDRDFIKNILHPEISPQVDQGNFDVLFEAEPFEDYSFNSYDYENGIWRFEGTASTASGCASEVIYASLNGKVIEFNVIPICPKP